MKVYELMEILEAADPEADVLLASQPSWPFEWSVSGAVIRSEIPPRWEEDEDELPPDDEDDDPDANIGRDTWFNNGRSSDVILTEGSQLRYGKHDYWGN